MSSDSDERNLRRRPLRDSILAAVLILIAHAALLSPWLLTGDRLVPVDLRSPPPWRGQIQNQTLPAGDWAGTDKLVFNYPNIARWKREIQRDPEALHWNPDNWCGIAYLATQNTHVLYPLNFVWLQWDIADGMTYYAWLHGFLAGFFAWCLLYFGLQKVTWLSATMGALVYSGSGWFLAHQDLIQFIQAATWIPLVILGADLCVRRCTLPRALLLAIAFAISWFGGMPQITIIGLVAAGLTAAARALAIMRQRRRQRQSLRAPILSLGGTGLAVALGLCIAAPQLLPTLKIRESSGRSAQSLSELKAEGARAIEATGLLWPELLGNPPALSALSRKDPEAAQSISKEGFRPLKHFGLMRSGDTLIERIFAPSLIAVICILLAFFSAQRGALALGCLLIIIGFGGMSGTFILDLLYPLPGFAFANPRRLVFLLVLGISLLVALGADRLSRRAALPLASMVFAITASALALAFMAPEFIQSAFGVQAGSDPQAQLVQGWLVHGTWLACAAGAAALLALWATRRSSPNLRRLAFLIIMLAELGVLHSRLSPPQDGDAPAFPQTRILQWLADQHGDLKNQPNPNALGLGRIIRYRNPQTDLASVVSDLPPIPPNLGMLFEIPDAQGYEAVTDRHLEQLMERVEAGTSVAHHLLRELREPKSLGSPILDLMGVRWVLSPAIALPYGTRVAEIPTDWMLEERMAVFERPNCLPRVTTPKRLVVCEGEDAVLEYLSSPAFAPQSEAVLSSAEGLKAHAESLIPDAASGTRIMEFSAGAPDWRLVSYRPTEVRLAVKSPGLCALRLADTWHPGWKASFNGEPVEVLRSDHAFRLLLLPKGEGELRIGFEAEDFRLGLLVLKLSLGLYIGGALALLYFRKRSQAESAGQKSSNPS